MPPKFSAPRGTVDILPEDVSLWTQTELTSRRILETYGYREIRTPLFEETELFARSMGQTSDVVQKQMLNLSSQMRETSQSVQDAPLLGGNSLRPEATASVIRAYIEHGLDRKQGLSKLYYIGPMFRGERPQKGRLRQFHQIGVEAIGPESSSPYLDAEVILLSVNILKSLGLKDFQVKINTLGSIEDKNNFSKFLRLHLGPHVHELCPDCQNRFERNIFRILDCKRETCQLAAQQVNLDYSYLSQESQEYYKAVKDALDTLNVIYTEVPSLVRGLDYYTHTVFEITSSSLGSQDALGAGGRYNNLAAQLGGAQLDAVGFALGMERILLAVPAKKRTSQPSLNAAIITLDDISFEKGFSLLNVLRKEGISCDMSYKTFSLKSQMRYANKIGSDHVIILGEEERKKEIVALRDMRTGLQQEISIKGDDFTKLISTLRKGS